MSKAQQAKSDTDIAEAKEAAILKVTEYIQDYMDKKYVKNESFASGINTTGDYVADQMKGNGVTSGSYTIKTTGMDLTVSKSGVEIVTGTILDNGSINNWRTTTSDGGGDETTGEPLTIGDDVEYSTSLNGVTLDDWKVFYSDSNYTYLILGDCLPTTAISDDLKTTYDLETDGYEIVYCEDYENYTEKFFSAVTVEDYWKVLLTGTINDNEIDYTDSTNDKIFAMGTPTLELWAKSWNEKYPNDRLYIQYDTDIETYEGSGEYYDGYYIGKLENPKNHYNEWDGGDDRYFAHLEGHASSVHFAHNYDEEDADNHNAYGYALASPSAAFSNSGVFVSYSGMIGNGDYEFDGDCFGIRPVICLPTSEFN